MIDSFLQVTYELLGDFGTVSNASFLLQSALAKAKACRVLAIYAAQLLFLLPWRRHSPECCENVVLAFFLVKFHHLVLLLNIFSKVLGSLAVISLPQRTLSSWWRTFCGNS